MSTDDTMRRIEEDLDHYVDEHEWAEFDDDDGDAASEARAKLIATIRAALQPDDAEHERAVEAWREEAGKFRIWSEPRRQWFYDLDCAAFDEALRLMRWQPKTTNTETTDG